MVFIYVFAHWCVDLNGNVAPSVICFCRGIHKRQFNNEIYACWATRLSARFGALRDPLVNTGFVKFVLPLRRFVKCYEGTLLLADSAYVFVHFTEILMLILDYAVFQESRKRSKSIFVKIDSNEKTHPTII